MNEKDRIKFVTLSEGENKELELLEKEREENDKRHKEITLRLAQLYKKGLGQAYKFQNSHEHT